MLKKLIVLLSILFIANNINCGAASAHPTNSSDPALKELIILTDILNRNKTITPLQKDKFTEKLEHFLHNYEGSDKTFNAWKQIVKHGKAITNPLFERISIHHPIIQELVSGNNWTDELLRMELSQIQCEDDIFKILPYLEILTKTNANIDYERAIHITFNGPYYDRPEAHTAIIALTYCFINKIPQQYLNISVHKYYATSLLTFAIVHDSIYAVNELLKNPNINVNQILDNRDPLSYAIRYSSPEIVAMLLKHNAIISKWPLTKIDYLWVPSDNARLLLWAIKKNYLEIVRILKSKSDELEITPYSIYSIFLRCRDNSEAIKTLIENFDIESIYPLALIDAVHHQDERLAETLIENGFNRKIRDESGKIALDYAKKQKNRRLISLLETYTI